MPSLCHPCGWNKGICNKISRGGERQKGGARPECRAIPGLLTRRVVAAIFRAGQTSPGGWSGEAIASVTGSLVLTFDADDPSGNADAGRDHQVETDTVPVRPDGSDRMPLRLAFAAFLRVGDDIAVWVGLLLMICLLRGPPEWGLDADRPRLAGRASTGFSGTRNARKSSGPVFLGRRTFPLSFRVEAR
jgi:hypothetical protein